MRNKLNATLSMKNTEPKCEVAKLEVILSKKELKICMIKGELEKANQTLEKFNSSTTKLDSILMIVKDS